jgi:hypothetical protein
MRHLVCRGAYAALLSLPLLALANLMQGVPPTQGQAPPALQGTVHRVAAGGGDQTATINDLGAVSGDTVFFDQGNHQICGTVKQVAGVVYIGPTVTYPLLGQSQRAVLDGCKYTGNFIPPAT